MLTFPTSNVTMIYLFILSSSILCTTLVKSFGAVSFAQSTPHNPLSSFRIDMVGDAAATGQMVLEDNSDHLYEPKDRDDRYGKGSSSDLNVAQYLVDLHDAKGTLNFCGGMMFQLVLSDRLRKYLLGVADSGSSKKSIEVFDASKTRMFQIPEYEKSAKADNLKIFHGREIRKVTDAAGGMGMVLQLSLADINGDGEKDPEGWTAGEIEDYDGWGHDVGRTWRNGTRLKEEGFPAYIKQFGQEAFGLHHRFYLHFDGSNKMWLSAEDGCEGTPAAQARRRSLFDAFKGFS